MNTSITSNMSYSNINSNLYRTNDADIHSNTNTPTGKLRVGVMKDSQPFSYCKQKKIPKNDINDTPDKFTTEINGIAVKIWENVAKKNKYDYEYICIDSTYNQAIEDLTNNKYDVLLGNFTVTIERLKNVLFTRAFFIEELRVFRKKQDNFIANLFKNRFLIFLIVFFFFIILIFTFIYKYFKHTSLIESFFYIYGSFFQNELYLFYPGSSNIMIRTINFFWSFIRFTFFAVIITQMVNIIIQTSSYEFPEEEIKNIKDLHVIGGSAYVDLIKNMGKNPIPVKDENEAITKIKNSDEPIYYFGETIGTNNVAGNYKLASTTEPFFNDEFAIIVNKKNPDIVEKIDSEIVHMQDSDEMLNICKVYLQDRYDACLL